jgi:invasion protein IalB
LSRINEHATGAPYLFAAMRPLGRDGGTLVIRRPAASASMAVLLALTCNASAQEKKAQPKRAPMEKHSPRPVQPTQPPIQPAQGPNVLPQQAGALPPIVYSPWAKFCGKDNARADAKEACLTMKEARLETGQFLAGAALIEQAGQDKKVVRITVPLAMQLTLGTRLQLDHEPVVVGRYITCVPNGCIADHEVDAAFVSKLKQGQQIVLQSVNLSGQVAYIAIPLTDFAKVNDGPPTDPKKYEEEQKRRQEELRMKQPR